MPADHGSKYLRSSYLGGVEKQAAGSHLFKGATGVARTGLCNDRRKKWLIGQDA